MPIIYNLSKNLCIRFDLLVIEAEKFYIDQIVVKSDANFAVEYNNKRRRLN